MSYEMLVKNSFFWGAARAILLFCDDVEPAERRRKNKNFLELQALRCHGTVYESHPKMSHFYSANSNLKRSSEDRRAD